MSSAPPHITVPEDASRLPVTLAILEEKHRLGEALVMVTAYDFPSARAAEAAGVDLVLVGDSGAMTVLGYPSTIEITTDEMIMLTRAARRGLRTPLLVADLAFGSYEESDEQAIRTAMRFAKEARADAVKLERGNATSVSRARAIVQAGIPVMGHVGLTPQTSTALGGYRAQGRRQRGADRRGDAGATGRRLFRDRARGGPGRRHRRAGPTGRCSGDRHRSRPGDCRPSAGVPRPARHP
jgi:3-methyl-2-oxobutanoate hydroxymethyltransferase